MCCLVNLKKHFLNKADINTKISHLKNRIDDLTDILDVKKIEIEEEGNDLHLSVYFYFGSGTEAVYDDEGFVVSMDTTDNFWSESFSSGDYNFEDNIEKTKEKLKEYRDLYLEHNPNGLMWENYDEKLLEDIFLEVERVITLYRETGECSKLIIDDSNKLFYDSVVITSEEILATNQEQIDDLLKQVESLEEDMSCIDRLFELKKTVNSRYFKGDVYSVESENDVQILLRAFQKKSDSPDCSLTREDLGLSKKTVFPYKVCFEFVLDNPFAVDTDTRKIVTHEEIFNTAREDIKNATDELEFLNSLLEGKEDVQDMSDDK